MTAAAPVRHLQAMEIAVLASPSPRPLPQLKLCRNSKNRKIQAGGHSLGIIRQWSLHGLRRAATRIFLLSFVSAVPWRRHTGETQITSSPADASSFMPSRPDYDTVSFGGEGKGEGPFSK